MNPIIFIIININDKNIIVVIKTMISNIFVIGIIDETIK